ncbi:MAG: hypothetical protein ACRDN9_14900 [Streptosporangiaceae bacterium]
MIRAAWHKTAPWLTPTLVVVEVGLVWSGLLPLRTAVVVGMVVEALLWVTVAGRTIAAVRRFRAGRAEGADLWMAAEQALAQLVPRRLARVLLIEPRLWWCLARWVAGRHEGRRGYRYHECVRMTIWIGVGLVVIEGAVADAVVALILPGSPWPWVVLGLHLYALVFLLGFYASLVTRPHLLERGALRLRQSVLAEVLVPYSAIVRARVGAYPDYARSWFKIDRARGVATLAYGDANVVLTLDPTEPILVRGSPCETPLTTLYLTVDRPRAFVDALMDGRRRTDRPAVMAVGEHRDGIRR